jgi:tRNA(Ile)-lysidine synthase
MKKEKVPLESKVVRFIKQNNLIGDNKNLLAAVSGGPDSVCLLLVLYKISEQLGINLHVAHLDHCLRGEESREDAEFVRQLAKQLGIPATIGSGDVKSYQKAHHLSEEEAARDVRYEFLAKTADSVGAGAIAVGHTSDDQVETVLLHLIRGTGMRGLRGLQPFSRRRVQGLDLRIIRPLLETNRTGTVEYCRTNGIEPRLDSSNLSLSPLRNRIRHQLIPLLKTYNRGITEALLRTSRLASDDLAILEKETGGLNKGIAARDGESLMFDKEKFISLSPGLQRYLLRDSVEEILGSLQDIETRHIEEIIEAAGKPAGKKLSLPRGLKFSTGYSSFKLSLDEEETIPLPLLGGECILEIPGITTFSGWEITASLTHQKHLQKNEDVFAACLDYKKTGDRVLVRARKKGDEFQPFGMSRTKELAEFMIDARIPRAWRDRIPIVSTPDSILWVAGYRLDDRVKVTADTKQVLLLKFLKK